jgi:hypothetical protein
LAQLGFGRWLCRQRALVTNGLVLNLGRLLEKSSAPPKLRFEFSELFVPLKTPKRVGVLVAPLLRFLQRAKCALKLPGKLVSAIHPGDIATQFIQLTGDLDELLRHRLPRLTRNSIRL